MYTYTYICIYINQSKKKSKNLLTRFSDLVLIDKHIYNDHICNICTYILHIYIYICI